MISNDYSIALFENIATKSRIEIMIREYSIGEFLWKEAFNQQSVISKVSAQTLCNALSQINKLIDVKYSSQHVLIHPNCEPYKIERNVVWEGSEMFEITNFYSKEDALIKITKEKIH